MYQLINAYVDILLEAIRPDVAIAPYNQLIRSLQEVDVSNDQSFRNTYAKYWGLNAARLAPDFENVYFQLLETLKASPDNAEVKFVASKLCATPTSKDGQRSLQFSFSSKLVHMIYPHRPVYDNTVERFFFLPGTETLSRHEKKLDRLMKSYNFLISEYQRILDNGILAQAITRFRAKYPDTESWTDEKIIDTLIWQFVSFMRKGEPIS